MVQCLRLHTPNKESMGSIPGLEIKTSCATQSGQKKNQSLFILVYYLNHMCKALEVEGNLQSRIIVNGSKMTSKIFL